jgi:hypothetical protein
MKLAICPRVTVRPGPKVVALRPLAIRADATQLIASVWVLGRMSPNPTQKALAHQVWIG